MRTKLWWKCSACEIFLSDEPALALHMLERHDVNILIQDGVRLEPLKIILPKTSKFWIGVEFSPSKVGLRDEFFETDDYDEVDDKDYEMDCSEEEGDGGANDEEEDNDDDKAETATKAKPLPLVKAVTGVQHPCYLCDAKFPTKKKLTAHRKKHKGEKLFTCDDCSLSHSTWTRLQMHKLEHTDEWPELKQDKKKLAEYSRKFKLERRNWRMQFYVPPKKHQCPHCPKTYDWATGLKRHIAWHKNEKPFVCKTCGSAYRARHSLTNHIRQEKCSRVLLTAFSRGFQCELCPARVKSEKGLVNHRRMSHGIYTIRAKPEHKCDQCGYNAKSQSNLRNHLLSHSREKPFDCEAGCGATFTLRGNMLAHVRSHCATAKKTGLDIQFQEEQKAFLTKDNKWSEIKGGLDCPECGKNYSCLGKLELHLRIHGDGKYKCPICQAGFGHKVSVPLHQKEAHPELLIHKCDRCEEKFLDTRTMASHRRLKHGLKKMQMKPDVIVKDDDEKPMKYSRNDELEISVSLGEVGADVMMVNEEEVEYLDPLILG